LFNRQRAYSHDVPGAEIAVPKGDSTQQHSQVCLIFESRCDR